MRTTIDSAGRLVVPKPIRDRLRLLGGAEVDVVEHDGVIEVVPVPAPVDHVDTGHGTVLRPRQALPPLTDADLYAAIDDSRR